MWQKKRGSTSKNDQSFESIMKKDDLGYSIENKVANPMNAVLNK
jgi:hypothetical protein